MVPVGEESTEEDPLGRSQDRALGGSLAECQADERGEVTLVNERVRRGGEAQRGREDCLQVSGWAASASARFAVQPAVLAGQVTAEPPVRVLGDSEGGHQFPGSALVAGELGRERGACA